MQVFSSVKAPAQVSQVRICNNNLNEKSNEAFNFHTFLTIIAWGLYKG
jgi:hypothetical protein